MNPTDPVRMAAAIQVVDQTAREISRRVETECAATETPPARVAIEIAKSECEEFCASVAVLEEILRKKHSETRDDEAVAVVREIARRCTALAASAVSVLVNCQAEIPELPIQLSH